MVNNIKASLDELKVTDVYSLIMFALYKMSDIPEYSALSELVYVLDKDSLFNFLECFGGTTIRVPTVKELKIVINALLLYQFVNLEGKEMEQAIQDIDMQDFRLRDVLSVYNEVCSVLKNYNFKRD